MLKDIINKKNINQTELSKELKIDRSTLYRYINDEKALLKAPFRNIIKLCEELTCTIEDISFEYSQLYLVNHNRLIYQNVNTMLNLSINRIKNYFTLQEKQFLTAMLNGTIPEYKISLKYFFEIQITDYIKYNQLESGQFNIDQNDLIKKIKGLEEIDLFCLIRLIEQWWNQRPDERDLKDIF